MGSWPNLLLPLPSFFLRPIRRGTRIKRLSIGRKGDGGEVLQEPYEEERGFVVGELRWVRIVELATTGLSEWRKRDYIPAAQDISLGRHWKGGIWMDWGWGICAIVRPEIDPGQIQELFFFFVQSWIKMCGVDIDIWSAYHLVPIDPFCGASWKQHMVS
jgi:hypothetical protein